MIKNYFKIAWRNLVKNKSFTFINLLGLATGFAITLLIIQYVRFELSYENIHVNADKIVRLTTDYLEGETVVAQDCETNPPLGPLVMNELSEVVNQTRVYPLGEPTVNVKIGNENFVLDKFFAADSSYFDIFTAPFIYGNKKDIFKHPNEAVITESIALKYFGKTNAIGETIEIPFALGSLILNVTGVIKDSPPNTHLKVNVLVSYPTMLNNPILKEEYGEKENNWDGNNTLTYVMLGNNVSYDRFETASTQLVKKLQNEFDAHDARFVPQKIKDIHLYSNKPFEVEPNGNATSVYFLLGVAILVIISAFVNYVNLATSKALDRAKEVGIRKVVGSTKTQLKIQFLLESLIVNILASVFALILIVIAKQKFIEVSGIPPSFNIFTDIYFWLSLLSFILLGVILSGLYPAFVMSSFKPSSVLKGSFSHSTQGELLRKSLVVFQFAITIVLLVQIFTVNTQLDFLRNMNVGVETDKTIIVQAPSQNKSRENFGAFKQQLLQNANIEAVSLSMAVPGQISSQFATTTGIHLKGVNEEQNHNYYITNIDEDFIPLMEMQILAGENFNASSNRDKNEVIVNEKAIELWNIPNAQEAVGKTLRIWGNDCTIKAVVKNYHQESAKSPFIPIIHMYADYFWSLASIKFVNSNPKQQVATIENIYASHFPGTPFSYFFMDKEYDKQYKNEERFQSVFTVLTGFSILIACLGLFGLVMFTVHKRQKEIGIRKVLGASVINIMALLSSNFLKTVLISIIIGMPITYVLTKKWLENFAFRIELNWWLFIAPIVLILVLVMLSISANTIRTAIANPVESLKEE